MVQNKSNMYKRNKGLMKPEDIFMSFYFKDSNGLRNRLEYGYHGWTVIWANGEIAIYDFDINEVKSSDELKSLCDKHFIDVKSYIKKYSACNIDTENVIDGKDYESIHSFEKPTFTKIKNVIEGVHNLSSFIVYDTYQNNKLIKINIYEITKYTISFIDVYNDINYLMTDDEFNDRYVLFEIIYNNA